MEAKRAAKTSANLHFGADVRRLQHVLDMRSNPKAVKKEMDLAGKVLASMREMREQTLPHVDKGIFYRDTVEYLDEKIPAMEKTVSLYEEWYDSLVSAGTP